jgi:hypothetical protein
MVLNSLSSRVRTRQVRRYALNAGFAYLNDTLVSDFPLRQCSFYSSWNWNATISDAVTGKTQDKEILFFDWTVDSGESRSSQTVLAIRGADRTQWVTRLDLTLVTEHVDDWILFYRPNTQLGVAEIDALISSA